MYGFYNYEGCNDVFLISKDNATKPLERLQVSSFDKYDDLIVLKNEHEIIGYHILQASKYFNNLKLGLNFFDEISLDILNKILVENGLEKESLQQLRTNENFIVVGEVVECINHPDSDHLHICKVDVKDEILSIVCGASNVRTNIKVIVAKIGAVLPGGLVIRKGQLRKVDSYGMLCSYRELGINKSNVEKGIAILEEKYIVGESFFV